MKKAIAMIMITVLLLTAFGCGADTEKSSPVSDVETTKKPEGVYILAVAGFTGIFAEDGNDRMVENVVQVAFENKGDKDIQLLTVEATDSEGRKLTFEITTLPAHGKLACCEKNGAAYVEGLSITQTAIKQVIYFEEELSLQRDTLTLLCADNTIEVQNTSEKDYPGGKLFYKTVQGDIFTAGITYSLSIPPIAKGESTTLTSRHYSSDSSRIVFITNAE